MRTIGAQRMQALSLFATAIALLFAHALAAAATGAAVAMVSDVQGKATLVSGASRSPLSLLADVEAGAQVDVEGGARVVLLYLDGSGEYVVSGPALVAVRPQQPQAIKGAAPQKRSVLGGKSNDVRLKALGAVQGALVMRSMGSRSRIRLVSPAGTRTTEASPEFRWQNEQTGLTYHFELLDETGKVIHERDLSGDSLKLPANVRLAENVRYSWTVSARTAEGHKYSTSADLMLAPPSLRQQISALRPAASAPVSDRVAYASWLEQLELKDEARPIWRALAAERPHDERLQAIARE